MKIVLVLVTTSGTLNLGLRMLSIKYKNPYWTMDILVHNCPSKISIFL
jgi:hypothetical protein